MNAKNEIASARLGGENAELTTTNLEAVAGGKDWTDTSLSYDVGWLLSAAAKQAYDFTRGVYDGIADDD